MSTAAPPLLPTSAGLQRAASLPMVLLFTFVTAVASGLVTSGLFFAARGSYALSQVGNYGLGVALGGAYTVGAIVAPRLVARAGGEARRVMAGLLLALAAVCCVPASAPGRPWTLWVVAVGYGAAAAMLWPIVHSYLSGGRGGRGLRVAVGRFNLTWGSALVLAYGAFGPSLELAPEATLAALALVHLASGLCLLGLPARPAPAAPPAADADPEDRAMMLRRVFEALLPITNVLGFALAPFLPDAFAKLGLPESERARFAVAWLLPRALAFAVLARWHGWRDRTSTAVVGAAALVVGFGTAVLAPWIDRGALGLTLELLGLATFGTGMAIVYTAAFYYAQVAGRSSVGAGGRHEALLGMGATAGPALGVLVAATVASGLLARVWFEPLLTAGCVLLALVLCARAGRARTLRG